MPDADHRIQRPTEHERLRATCVRERIIGKLPDGVWRRLRQLYTNRRTRPSRLLRQVRLWPLGHLSHVPFLGFFLQPHLPAAWDASHRDCPDWHLQNLKPALLSLGPPSELLTAVPALHLPVRVPHRRPVRIVRSLLGHVRPDSPGGHAVFAAVILKAFSGCRAPVGMILDLGGGWSFFAHLPVYIIAGAASLLPWCHDGGFWLWTTSEQSTVYAGSTRSPRG